MAPTILTQAFGLVSMSCIASMCVGGGLLYFRHVRLSRPPLGIYDTSDMASLFICLLLLPVLYLALPSLVLTIILALMSFGTLQTGLSPLLGKRLIWAVVPGVLAAVLGTALLAHDGWQPAVPLHLVINDLLLVFTVIVAANINTQYGMRLSYVAWYSLFLACYDAFFLWIIPLTSLLGAHLVGLAFNLSFGVVLGGHQIYLGVGDMLMFTLVACTSYKSYGLRGIISAVVVIGIFGVFLPTSGLPMLFALLGIKSPFIPVQFTFGPAVFVSWLRLSRRAPERTMRQWLQSRRPVSLSSH